MSISLQNVESRVTALENRKGTNLTLLTSSPVFLNRSWKNLCNMGSFNTLLVVWDHGASGSIYDSNGFIINNVVAIPLNLFDIWPVKSAATNVSGTYEYTILRKSGTYIQGYSTQDGENPSDNKVLIYGLNL